MKAFILAAGIGGRLGELTKETPKCLVPLADGSVMLDKVVSNLKNAGVNDVIINLFHLGDKIVDHVKNRNHYGITVEFVREAELLGTGGGLKNIERYFSPEESFFMHNSDIYSDINLLDLFNYHRDQNAIASLSVMKRESSRALVFDNDNLLIGWQNSETAKEIIRETADQTKYGFSGIQVISAKLFRYMKELSGDFSIITAYLNAAKDNQRVLAYTKEPKIWIDMGTPAKLGELNLLLNQKEL